MKRKETSCFLSIKEGVPGRIVGWLELYVEGDASGVVRPGTPVSVEGSDG